MRPPRAGAIITVARRYCIPRKACPIIPAMRRRTVTLVTLIALSPIPLTAGCDSGLVTDYQPRRLGDSPGVRRGYYAPRYSPEGRAAEQERAAESKDRRPAPSVGGPAPY